MSEAPTRIPQSFIRELVDRTDIVEIVRARVEMKKKGQNYQARCPFHEEKTPSFTVSETKQFYYCFGCGAHGNALDFLMNYDRMEFRDAIEYLATQHGMDVPKIAGYSHDHSYDALFTIMKHVTQFYRQQLAKHPAAIEYLKSRGLTGEIAKTFAIGYAPAGWDNLIKHIGRDPKSQSHLNNAGMSNSKEAGNYYDRFRNRIMFPIHDTRGRVIAFGGRTMGDEQPKYLNSPETAIFHKSQELYGLYQARQANRSLERLLVVEGYMDVVSLFQQGITYAVATLGTAINIKHLQKCLRFTQEIVFCFDGDNAGRNAAWKALTIAMPSLRDGIQLRFLFVPQGEDPDSLVQRIGKTAFETLIDKATPLQQVFFDGLTQQFGTETLADKAAFAKAAKDHISKMPQGIYQELLYDELAKHIGVTRQELSQAYTDKQTPKPTVSQNKTSHSNSKLNVRCIHLLVHAPELAKNVQDLHFLYESTDTNDVLLLKLIHIFKEHPKLPIGQLLTHWDHTEEQRFIAQLAAKNLSIPQEGFKQELLDTINAMRQTHHKQQLQHLIQKSKQQQLTTDERQQLKELLKTQHTKAH